MNFNLCAVREMAPILSVIHLRMTPGTQVSGHYMALIQEHIEGILHPDWPAGEGQGEGVHAELGVEKGVEIKMVIMAGESINAGTLSCKDPGGRQGGKMTKKSGTMLCH